MSLILNFTMARAEESWHEHRRFQIQPATHYQTQVPLNIIWLRESFWTKAIIESQIRTVEKVFSQCKVSFSPVNVVEASYKDGPSFAAAEDAALIRSQPFFSSRPLIFLAETETSRSSLAGAYAKRSGLQIEPDLMNVMVCFHLGYSVTAEFQLAHELAHILFNEPHNSISKNILNGSLYDLGAEISSEQCAKIGAARL